MVKPSGRWIKNPIKANKVPDTLKDPPILEDPPIIEDPPWANDAKDSLEDPL
jgi:hypothetical protein